MRKVIVAEKTIPEKFNVKQETVQAVFPDNDQE
jgi:hypothetical protein